MKLCFYSTENMKILILPPTRRIRRGSSAISAIFADGWVILARVVRVFAGFCGRVGDFGRKRQTFRKERNSRFRSQRSSPLNTSNDASLFVLAVFFISMKVKVTQLFYINEGLVVKIFAGKSLPCSKITQFFVATGTDKR